MRKSVAALGLVLSLPFWLPKVVIRLRVWIFARVNGDNAIEIPGPLVPVEHFKEVYSHPAADGRSKGAGLSDLFWYWLAPGPQVHQEHLEPGERYDEVAALTRRILAVPTGRVENLTTRCVNRILDELPADEVTTVRLRDVMMPVWAEFYYELVFGEPCPTDARRLIVDNADDVVTALKCCGIRHMDRRDRLTKYLLDRVKNGDVKHDLPPSLSIEEQAYYLQGAFFNTAVVQMSEAMTHLFLVLAQHRDVQQRAVSNLDDDRYLDRVVDETLRQFPLFGIAHRITSGDIDVDGTTTIAKGSVLCFNYPEFQATGFDHPDEFDPERWAALSAKDVNYIPFGIAANRPCPAWRLAPITMRVAARETLRRYAMYSSVSHTRSIPHRGPCLLVRRSSQRSVHLRLTAMRGRDRIEDVGRSVVQLVLGTYMVADARRLRLTERYFDTHDLQGCPVGHGAR